MRIPLSVALLVLAVGCSEPRKMANIGETIPNLPLPPSAAVLSREGSEDALKIQFHSSDSPEDVANYYRNTLSQAPWTLVSDTKQADGTVALYAEQNGPPLWVTIRKADGASGSIVDLAGAKVAPKRKDSVTTPAVPQ